jgi:hypothetical protein
MPSVSSIPRIALNAVLPLCAMKAMRSDAVVVALFAPRKQLKE